MASSANYQSWVEVVPEFKGFNKSVEKNTTASLSKAGDKGGGVFGKGLAGAIGKIAKPLAIAGGAALAGVGVAAGLALSKGLDRALSIQDAQAKLKGLGHSGESVTSIMNNALASVKGTAFGLGDAAGVAAGAVAAGIKPGKELTRVLKLTADAASIAGTDLSSMGSIFNKVAASGKLQGDVIAQLQDAGVPVLQFVAKEMGVTAGEAAKLASAGKVNFETFANAMETGLGGAALSSGETFRGAFANMGAALGRFGAIFQTPIVAAAPSFFTGVTTAIDSLTTKAGPLADAFGKKVGPALESAGSAIVRLADSGPDKVARAFRQLKDVSAPVADAFASLRLSFAPVIPLLKDVLVSISPIVLGIRALATSMPEAAAGAGQLIEVMGVKLASGLEVLIPKVIQLAGQFSAYLVPALSKLLPALGEAAITLVPALGAAFVALAPSVADLLIAMLPLIPLVTELIITALPPLVSLLTQLLGPTGQSAEGMSGLAAAISGVVSAFSSLVSFAPGGIQAILTVADVIRGTITPTQLAGQALRGELGPAFAYIAQVSQLAANVVRAVFQAIAGAANVGSNAVRSAVSAAFGSIPAPVRAALALMQSAVSGGIGNVMAQFSGLGGRISAVVAGFGGQLFSAGTNLIAGFANGISAGASRVISAAANVARSAITAAKAALDIHSPSRVFLQLGRYVGDGFAKGITGSSKTVQKSMTSLSNKITDAFNTVVVSNGKVLKKATKTSKAVYEKIYSPLISARQRDTVKRWLAQDNDRLRTLALERAKVADRLKNAEKTLTDRIKVAADFRKKTISDVTGSVDATKASSSGSLIAELRKRVSDTKLFAATLTKLKKKGLDAATFAQFANAGPDALSSAQALLAGGSTDIRKIGALQSQLKTAATTLANSSSNEMYGAGIAAAQGLVKGLKSQSKQLADAMSGIAKNLVAKIKRELGIHSPSRVFEQQVGRYIPAGLVKGIDGGAGDVDASIRSLVALPSVSASDRAAVLTGSTDAASTGGCFVGNLVLDSGEFLGKVRGEIVRHDRAGAVRLGTGRQKTA